MAAFPPLPRPGAQALAASRIREIANAAMGRLDIAAFWFGESDMPTPDFIVEAARASLALGETFYTHNLGSPDLRAAIADYASALHATALAAERVAVTGSGVSALMLAAQLVVSPGDRVVVVTPIWPNIAEIPKILSAQVVRHPLTVSGGKWSLDLDALLEALTPETRMVIVNSPNNPTGWTMDRADQERLLAHCRTHGIWILSDEVYERLVFDGRAAAPSFRAIAAPEDRLMIVNSFSKAWRMTGWRLGWLIVPAPMMPTLSTLIEYNTSCTPQFVQRAGLAALTGPEGEAAVAEQGARLATARETLFDGFASLGDIEAPIADGAMYAFFRVAGRDDCMALARGLVQEVGLGLAPGSAFGPEGEGWLRWCFAASSERIAQGLERLDRFLKTR